MPGVATLNYEAEFGLDYIRVKWDARSSTADKVAEDLGVSLCRRIGGGFRLASASFVANQGSMIWERSTSPAYPDGPKHDNDRCDVALSEGPEDSACAACRRAFQGGQKWAGYS